MIHSRQYTIDTLSNSALNTRDANVSLFINFRSGSAHVTGAEIPVSAHVTGASVLAGVGNKAIILLEIVNL